MHMEKVMIHANGRSVILMGVMIVCAACLLCGSAVLVGMALGPLGAALRPGATPSSTPPIESVPPELLTTPLIEVQVTLVNATPTPTIKAMGMVTPTQTAPTSVPPTPGAPVSPIATPQP